jgi:hypothetical protein
MVVVLGGFGESFLGNVLASHDVFEERYYVLASLGPAKGNEEHAVVLRTVILAHGRTLAPKIAGGK